MNAGPTGANPRGPWCLWWRARPSRRRVLLVPGRRNPNCGRNAMKPADEARQNIVCPSLAELLAGYLQRQGAAEAAGLGLAPTGEVVPFEAAPVQPVDPRLAWTEAVAAVRFFRPQASRSLTPPPDWPGLV